MKKQTIKSMKLKNQSDPLLTKSHSRGTIVEMVQPALDPRWGRFYFTHYHRSWMYLKRAEENYQELINLLSRCQNLPVDTSNSRLLTPDLRNQLEIASTDFLIHLKLGLEYLCEEILPIIQQIENHFKLKKTDIDYDAELSKRIGFIQKGLRVKTSLPQELSNLLVRRDIVEHPNKDRLYDIVNWENVHLAWVLSGKVVGTMEKITPLLNEVYKNFEEYLKKYKISGELKGVQRGIKSMESIKKSKKKKS